MSGLGFGGDEESLIGTAVSCENQEVTLCMSGGGGRMAGSLPGSGGRVGRGDSMGLGVDVLQVPSCHLCQHGLLELS